MSRSLRFGAVALAVVSCLAVAVSAGEAAANKSVSCRARRGYTLLENTHGRIYKSHHRVYACAFASGINHLLVPRSVHSSDQSKDRIYHLLGDELQGNYVAWEYYDAGGGGTQEILDVLNLSTGHVRLVESHVSDTGDHFGGWVLNARGVVVFIVSVTQGSLVIESKPSGNKQLASGTPNEYTSLGISGDGDVVYWLDNGQYTGASIS